MSTSSDQLLSEFIDDWNAGRRPDVRAYLRRAPAGAERDELAEQLGDWLALAPTPSYDEPTRAAIRAEPVVQRVFAAADADAGAWPQLLPALRERSRLSLPELAGRLAERFGLGASDTERTAGYLERLERGELEPTRVSRRLLDALSDALGASPERLAGAGAFGSAFRPASAGGTLFRREEGVGDWVAQDLEVLSDAAFSPAPAQALDEVDRLFIGGPEA